MFSCFLLIFRIPLGFLWGPLGGKQGAKKIFVFSWAPRRVPGVDLAPILGGLGGRFRCILGLIFVFCCLWLSLLQNYCEGAARMLDSRFAARLPARPRPRFKIITARLLHGCCKACYKACCEIVVRVLQECLIQGLLQGCCKIARPPARVFASRWLLQDCCRVAARMLQCLLQGLLWEFCKVCHKVAARVLQGCCKTWCKTYWAASGIFL